MNVFPSPKSPRQHFMANSVKSPNIGSLLIVSSFTGLSYWGSDPLTGCLGPNCLPLPFEASSRQDKCQSGSHRCPVVPAGGSGEACFWLWASCWTFRTFSFDWRRLQPLRFKGKLPHLTGKRPSIYSATAAFASLSPPPEVVPPFFFPNIPSLIRIKPSIDSRLQSREKNAQSSPARFPVNLLNLDPYFVLIGDLYLLYLPPPLPQ